MGGGVQNENGRVAFPESVPINKEQSKVDKLPLNTVQIRSFMVDHLI